MTNWDLEKSRGILSMTKLVWARSMGVLSIDKTGSGEVQGHFVNDKTWLGPGLWGCCSLELHTIMCSRTVARLSGSLSTP